jgi:hypothetical protein
MINPQTTVSLFEGFIYSICHYLILSVDNF